MAITAAFQAEDRGSTPRTRSKLRGKIMSTKRLVEQAGAKRLILAKEGNVIMYEISAKHCVIYNNKQLSLIHISEPTRPY